MRPKGPWLIGLALAALAPVSVSFAGEISPLSARWSGFYLGGHFARHSIKTDGVFDGIERGVLPELDRIGDKGLHGGVHAGFAWQWSFVVAGLEADYGIGGFKRGFETPQDGGPTEAGLFNYAITGDLDYLATIRGRAGVSLNGPFGNEMLFYLTAGPAFTKFKMDIADGRGQVQFRDTGRAFGGGAEFSVGAGFSLRAEYLRLNFSKRIDIADETISGIFDANDGNFVKLGKVQMLRAGISYKLFP